MFPNKERRGRPVRTARFLATRAQRMLDVRALRSRNALGRLLGLVLALVFVNGCGGADTGQAEQRQTQVKRASDELISNPVSGPDILGFETSAGWPVVVGIQFGVATTDVRTQGTKALEVRRPSGIVQLQSAALSSTNAELAKIERGSTLAIDVMLPNEQINPFWHGELELFVTCPSRLLVAARIGEVDFNGLRTGVYNTLRFAVPNFVADALHGASYNDLKFSIQLEVPLGSPGTYRFDNLRVKSTLLPPPPTDISGIHGGDSILLEPWKTYSPQDSQVAEQTFTQGLIQIPRSFHTLLGNAGTGTATFEYRLGATATPVSCQYQGSGAQARDYNLVSCSNGALAGDLVTADWVRLTVVSGDASAGKTKIRAQIAENPLDDEIVPGLPPIPTFFGETAAEVEAAINSFIQEEKNWTLNDGAIVRLPTPMIPPITHIEQNGVVLPPTRPQDNDPPFALGDRITGTDLADAGWSLTGSISTPVQADGSRTLHFDADAGIDVYVLGGKISKVVDVNGVVETKTPAPSANNIPPTIGTATFCYSYLGITESCNSFGGDLGAKANLFDPIHASVTFIDLPFLVFSVQASGVLDISATLSGGFTPNGFAITVTPAAAASIEVSGGVSLGTFGGGGLFGSGQLLGIQIPISVSVDATFDPTPGFCNLHVQESLNGRAIVTSGGGSFGYYLEGGVTCGFLSVGCWRDEETITSWPAAFQQSYDIVPAQPLADQDISLDPSICPQINQQGDAIHYPPAGSVFHQGDHSFLFANEVIGFNDPNDPTHFTFVTLENPVWSSSDPSDVITDNALIRYGSPGSRTLSVVVSAPGIGQASDSVVVNVEAADLAKVPEAQILTPANRSQAACEVMLASGTATDPQGLPLTFHWFVSDLTPPNLPATDVGTGSSVSITQQGLLLRLIATDSAGNQGLAEYLEFHECPH